MFASFDAEIGTRPGDRNQDPIGADAQTSSKRGGRPPKEQSGGFVQAQALKLYVSHLKLLAPSAWTERQLNFELFCKKSPHEKLPSQSTPFNGTRALLTRKSIPRLDCLEMLSEGILKAEANPMFAGGLQILYHPYVEILSRPKTLGELQNLIALCSNATALGVFRYSAFGAVRTMRSAVDEIAAIDARISTLKEDAQMWQRTFLDVCGIAFGLALEAIFIGDSDRFLLWRQWFFLEKMRFEDWGRGGLAPRQALDRWIQWSLEQSSIPRINVFQTGFGYLQQQVLNSVEVGHVNDEDGTGTLRQSYMSSPEMAWIYLALLEGRPPSREGVAQLVIRHQKPDRKAVANDIEPFMQIRWV